MKIDYKAVVVKLDSILARGLSSGLGKAGGQVCVEAAVCEALGLPHSDDPKCVASAVRSFKITLNDSKWSSPEARAKGMRDLAIAQLGSLGVVDVKEFSKRIVEKIIRVLIPALFMEIFTGDSPEHQRCREAADRCRAEGSGAAAAAAAARWAADAADADAADAAARWADAAARWAAAAARWAAAADAAAAAAAADAADAAAAAARWAAAAARWAAAAAAAAAADAADAAAAAAARWAAAAARWAAAAAADAAARDKYLTLAAGLCLEVLRELKSPGCEYI